MEHNPPSDHVWIDASLLADVERACGPGQTPSEWISQWVEAHVRQAERWWSGGVPTPVPRLPLDGPPWPGAVAQGPGAPVQVALDADLVARAHFAQLMTARTCWSADEWINGVTRLALDADNDVPIELALAIGPEAAADAVTLFAAGPGGHATLRDWLVARVEQAVTDAQDRYTRGRQFDPVPEPVDDEHPLLAELLGPDLLGRARDAYLREEEGTVTDWVAGAIVKDRAYYLAVAGVD